MSDFIIRTIGLVKRYRSGREALYALDNVNLDVESGEFVAVMGPSGSGKTTLLNMLSTLDRPTSGKVIIDGVDVTRLKERELHVVRRKKVGQIFQQFYLIPTLTALENVIVPLIPMRVMRKYAEDKAKRTLKDLGLGTHLHHKPTELSGGQQQRVAIARALINEPSLLLADEPTGNLDSRTGAELMTLLRNLNDSGTTLLIVTHNPDIGKQARRTIRLKDGKVVEDSRGTQ